MTPRLIEKCFELEELEEPYYPSPIYLVDFHLIDAKIFNDIRPGKIIKLKNVGGLNAIRPIKGT